MPFTQQDKAKVMKLANLYGVTKRVKPPFVEENARSYQQIQKAIQGLLIFDLL